MDQELVGIGIVFGFMCLSVICLFGGLIYIMIFARFWNIHKKRKEKT